MGDLIGFEGFLNATTPFRLEEHKVVWKSNRRYLDFGIGNNYKPKCDYPRFWLESGEPVGMGQLSTREGGSMMPVCPVTFVGSLRD